MVALNSPHRRWLAGALIAAGLVCLAWVAGVLVEQSWLTHQARAAARARAAASAPTNATPNSPLVSAVPAGALAPIPAPQRNDPLTGLLSIPRLGYSEAVAEGDDEATLRVAIGHLPDTAVPWVDGNTALAGHRDTLFRSLAKIRVGDELALSTPHGDFQYRVSQTLIVDPDDVWVLAPAPGRQLTLITCYPFHYIGSAPHRFIVRAEPVDADSARVSDP